MASPNPNNRSRAAQRRRAAQQKRKNLLILCGLLSVILIILVISLVVLLNASPVVETLTVEAGTSAPDAKSFLKKSNKEAAFVTDMSAIDFRAEGTHNVVIRVGNKEYISTLVIKDTTAPTGKAVSGMVICGKLPPAEDLVSDITDVTKVTVSYQSKPDLKKAGNATAAVLLTDAAGNRTVINVPVTVEVDTVNPTLELRYELDRVVFTTDSISFKSYVQYSDDRTPVDDLKVKIDYDIPIDRQTGKKQVGTYPVTYTVTDAAGNTTTLTIQLTVKEKPAGFVDPDVAIGKAKQVLDRITTPGMSKAEKAAAIYNWIHDNMSYHDYSDKSRGWAANAMEGFTSARGDCYTYFATAKALLEAAGIPNIDVVKVKKDPSASAHYWSLIDVGNGWYHFDTTPRANNYTYSFFLYTDEEMLSYSAAHKDCFYFDVNAYPPRQTVSVQKHIKFNDALRVTIKESW